MSDPPTPAQRQLLEKAREAREAAYAPHSGFKVGAAVRAESGRIYQGCNVENSSFGLSICAERVAVFNAVCAGERKIAEIAVVAGGSEPSPPCGACRQVLFEFASDLPATVVMGNLEGSVVVTNLATLFPIPFEFRAPGAASMMPARRKDRSP